MYIELHRTFRELLRDESQGDDAGALSIGNATLTLPDLLDEYRVVILSEAGSGKTEEIREAVRRLRANGKAAFFLRLEHIVVDFDTAFEEGTLEEFQAWLASSDQGWVLLDSIDEARLRSPLDFEAAMRKLSKQLAAVKQRTHLVITGRAPAWRPKTDLELCTKLFPIHGENIAVAVDSADETTNERRRGENFDGASSVRIVTLEDLSPTQVRNFAEKKGINVTQPFLDAIERADAWSFTARPQDLDELTAFWLDNGSIGSRLELMQNSIKRRLKEPDQTRSESLPLASERALEGSQIIAAALVLTGKQTIQVPEGSKGVQGLKLDVVLPGWSDREISTLLQRSLFCPDIYGAVRFHHRSVKEYLAAGWFLKLLDQEVSRRKVEELFFREQYDLEVVVPSLRPLLPWLAMADNRILTKVRRIAPEIVFEGGDPVQLPEDVRSDMLTQICAQLASGTSTRSMADFAAIQRFAAPDITNTLRRLVREHQTDDDIVFFLMRMVWQGRLRDALPETMDIANSSAVSYFSRIAAFRAVADLGTQADMASIRAKFSQEGSDLNRKCMADLVSHIRHPDTEALQWLMACIPRLAEHNEYEGTGLSEEIASFFQRAPLSIVSAGLEKLHDFLISSPVIERFHCEISKRYQWLRRAAGVAVSRLIQTREMSALCPHSLTILRVLPAYGLYNVRGFDQKELGLDECVRHWPDLKWALFWHIVEAERKHRTKDEQRLTDVWMVLAAPSYVSFDEDDFDSTVQSISERAIIDDKLVALSLAFRLYVEANRPRIRNSQLKKAVSNDIALKERLAELMKPQRKSEELKRLERENAKWSRLAAARSKRESQARLEAPAKLANQLNLLRDPGFPNSSDISRSQHYLFNRMRELEEDNNNSRWTSSNWRALDNEFGPETSRAFRDGMVRFWRGHTPQLVSEGAALNSISLADLFGLSGLTIEATESPELFRNLSAAEAAIAFRYAMRELNGFPVWFPALSNTHLALVKSMVLDEITFELQVKKENSSSQYLIYDLSHTGDWLWDVVAPDIIRILRTDPPKGVEFLRQLLDIVQASNLPDASIAALAAEKMISTDSAEHLPLWAASWTGVDPDSAIDAVERYLASLNDARERTDFVMNYVTHLLGGSHILSRVRARYHSPSILKRLYILVYQHVRSSEDIDRSNMGAYSPGLRDNAQEARERLVSILKEIPGRDAYLALKAISESHPEARMRPWFVQQARSKAETDSERPSWSAEQVCQFGTEFERTPSNHRELFDLAVLRLLDFKHELEQGDASTASVLINIELETVLRNYIGTWCNRHSLGRYNIPQEEELPDAKRPDLRWHCITFKGPVPTELKIADNWTGPQLFERLEGQLAGDYLRDEASSRGIYLLVYRGKVKRWQLPRGEMANFDELISALQQHWASVANTHPRVEEIKVIGIDLTKRAQSPVPKKSTKSKNASNKTKEKSINDSAARKRASKDKTNSDTEHK
jgi:hypothetical protein